MGKLLTSYYYRQKRSDLGKIDPIYLQLEYILVVRNNESVAFFWQHLPARWPSLGFSSCFSHLPPHQFSACVWFCPFLSLFFLRWVAWSGWKQPCLWQKFPQDTIKSIVKLKFVGSALAKAIDVPGKSNHMVLFEVKFLSARTLLPYAFQSTLFKRKYVLIFFESKTA